MFNPLHYTKKPSWVCMSRFGHLQKLVRKRACRCIKWIGVCSDYETCVSAPNMSNPLHYIQKPNLGMYLMFWSPSKTDGKTCPVGALNASVGAPITKHVFSRQTCRIHSITPKNQARVLSHVLVSIKTQRENGPRRCIKGTRSCVDYETCVFAPNLSNPLH